jgi:hypothetical protein
MLDEDLSCADQLVCAAAGLALQVRAGSLSIEEALMSLRAKYGWFPEESCRCALVYAIRASSAEPIL